MQPNKVSTRRISSKMFILAGVPAAIIVLALLWILFGVKPTYNYRFHQLIEHHYSSSQPGTSITLDQPKELTAVSSKTPNYSSYQYSRSIKGQSKLVAGIMHTSTKLTKSDLDTESKVIKDALSRTSASDNNPLLATGLLKLFRTWMPSGTTAHVTGSQSLTSEHVSNNGWVFDLAITSTNSGVASPMKGDYLYVLGKNGEYITLLYDHSWDMNSSTWQKVIDSYQVDQ